MSDRLGETAALATAFCWTISAVSFQAASSRIGSMVVNWIRLGMGLGFLSLLGLALDGRPLPLAPPRAWLLLGLSGIVGFVIGDLALFRAFVLVGARTAMLVMCLAPPMTAVLGRVFLSEHLSVSQMVGMALTVGAVSWTVLERRPAPAPSPSEVHGRHERVVGIALAGLGALGQAGGLLLSKLGMEVLPDPFGATQIRVLAGIGGFSVLFLATGWWSRVAEARRDRKALALTLLGSFFGPFLGVSLSLLAVQRTRAGVAAALMSLVPVLLIPVSKVLFQERVSWRSIAGTILAVTGVMVLFW